MRLPLGEVAPDEHHGGAGRRSEKDEACKVGIDLVGRQVGSEEIADENPPEERHRKRLHRPVDQERDADAAPVLLDPAERGEVDLDEHGYDHQPDQRRDRQVDPGDLGRADAREDRRRRMP
jgi:hypothetical protein